MLTLLLFTACSSKNVDSAPDEVPDHLTTRALEEATRAMTDLGPRLVATPQEEAARAAVEVLFLDAGLSDVVSEPFTWDAWVPGSATVTVDGQSFAAQPLSPSPLTQVSGALARTDYAGKIALLSSDNGSRADQFLAATGGGAEAMIRVTEDVDPDGALLIEVGHTLEGTSFPAVAVDHETGEALRALEGSAATLDIDSGVAAGHTSFNVAGRVQGSGSGIVFVVAHYDSWHQSHSAFDNGLGVGAMVVMARQLAAGPQPKRTVVFLATSGEEQGLQGAFAWVAEHEDEVEDGRLVMTLDVLWSAEGSFWVTATDADWIAAGIAAAAEEGIAALDGGSPSLASDHAPFQARGLDAIWCTRWRDPHYHTHRDTLDQLDLDQAAAAVRSQWRLLSEAAEVPEG